MWVPWWHLRLGTCYFGTNWSTNDRGISQNRLHHVKHLLRYDVAHRPQTILLCATSYLNKCFTSYQSFYFFIIRRKKMKQLPSLATAVKEVTGLFTLYISRCHMSDHKKTKQFRSISSHSNGDKNLAITANYSYSLVPLDPVGIT